MRDVLLESKVLGYNKTAVISEMKGNPSKIDIYGPDGDSILSLHITVSNPISSGRIDRNKLRLRLELGNIGEDLKEKILSLTEIPEQNKKGYENSHKPEMAGKNSFSNIILVKKGEKDSKVVVEFYNQQGQITSSRIYIHHYKFGGDADVS